jgi:hypothetical protein
MIEPSPAHPTIPPAYAQAFRDAVWRYSRWTGEAEPEVILDLKPVSISSVCKYVLSFNDPLPEDVFQKLFSELLIEFCSSQRRTRHRPQLRDCRPLLSEID